MRSHIQTTICKSFKLFTVFKHLTTKNKLKVK